MTADSPGRHDPILPNALHVARREYVERVGSRLFYLSTLLLATLAVVVAMLPLFARAVQRPTTSAIGVVAEDAALVNRSIAVLDSFLNEAPRSQGDPPPYSFRRVPDASAAVDEVADGGLDAALVAERDPTGRLDFRFFTGETIGADRVQVVTIAGTFAVAILDWTANNAADGAPPFQVPSVETRAAAGPTAGGAPISPAEYASRRIVGVVLVVMIFITLIIYGMWVAAGVVTEKTSRVMELMISAASARQLVIGKVAGIGLAGLTQAVAILGPALLAIVIQDPLATALYGPGPSVGPSLAGVSIGLIAAFVGYFVLGFVLYALIYAAAASMVSRAEDLQMLALPLSLIAIVGYLQAVLALTGGSGGSIRFASYVPFWSPFVMLTRLAVGRVQPWELVVSFGLLVVTIGFVYVTAVRVYAAGVLLYGQRPGLRAIVGAALGRS
jgi:ABC-2 type transport system permease protein